MDQVPSKSQAMRTSVDQEKHINQHRFIVTLEQVVSYSKK